jgi:hypothetical protein
MNYGVSYLNMTLTEVTPFFNKEEVMVQVKRISSCWFGFGLVAQRSHNYGFQL